MTAKEYLSQLRVLDVKIKQRIEERDELRSMLLARGISYDGLHVQTSPTNRLEELVAKYADMENDIDKMIDALYDQKHVIIGQIEQLDDDRYIRILRMHYVPDDSGRTKRLEEISVIMQKRNGDSYSYDHIARLHGEALQAFEQKFLK